MDTAGLIIRSRQVREMFYDRIASAIHGGMTQENYSESLVRKARAWRGRRKVIPIVFMIAVSCGAALGGKIDEKDPKWFMKLPVIRDDSRPAFILFSWGARSNSRRFALILDRDGTQQNRFLDRFDARYTTGIGIRELEGKLAKLPKGRVVTWMADEPRKLDHADQKLVRHLQKYAREIGIDIRLNYYLYHDP